MSDTIDNKCLLCDEILIDTNNKYCNSICRKRYYNWYKLPTEEFNKKKSLLKKLNETLICINCNNGFVPKQSNQLNYCSRKCSQLQNAKNKYKRKKENKLILKEQDAKKCLTCDKLIPINTTKVKFCCAVCRYRYLLWKKLDPIEFEEKIARAKTFGKEINCLHCNKSFIPDRINNLYYCSRKCHNDYGSNIIATKKKECRNYLKDKKTKAGKCENCDESNTLLLEFAHYDRNNKGFDVHECFDIELLKQEMSKGRWLCVLCHRIETHCEIKSIKIENKSIGYKYIYNKKMVIGKCQLCDFKVEENNHYCFDFDHLNQIIKLYNISQMRSFSIDEIEKEIDKCRLLCCKCHRLHSINQEKENREKKAILFHDNNIV